jgi:hypothetical protein
VRTDDVKDRIRSNDDRDIGSDFNFTILNRYITRDKEVTVKAIDIIRRWRNGDGSAWENRGAVRAAVRRG